MSIEDQLRAFIVDEIRNGWVPDDVTDDVHLIRSGIVDSLGVFELVAHLEREFGIEVRDDELVIDHFATVRAIATFVRSKRAEALSRRQ